MNHSLQFVTDVASAGMKHIVGLLSGALVHHFFFFACLLVQIHNILTQKARQGPRGPYTTLAMLDGITSGIVVNTWRPRYVCVLILLYMCPHTPPCVLTLSMCPQLLYI